MGTHSVLWIKTFHILCVMAWLAGVFYLPRIFVNYAEAKAAEERGKKEDAERNCSQARSQLRALQDGQRMQRTDPDTGERTVLGDDDRAADIARQQSLIEQWCK